MDALKFLNGRSLMLAKIVLHKKSNIMKLLSVKMVLEITCFMRMKNARYLIVLMMT